MWGFLKPAVHQPLLPASKIDHEYTVQRARVFAGIFIGYAAYYLVRNNLALAIPDILRDHPEYSKAQLGTALTGLSIAYGISKFLMGSVSDRSNPKYFLPLGLLLSCAIIAVCGFDLVYTSLGLLIGLMVLNGWVQGMGWPPCGKTMVHWFSTKERGRTVATWNVAHNVGGGLVGGIPLACVGLGELVRASPSLMRLFGDLRWLSSWNSVFFINASIAAVCAVGVFFLLQDTPQSRGLPPIEKYKNDYRLNYSDDHERTYTFKEIFFEHVLTNKYLWAIAIANAFVYFVRYGVVNWIPTYLEHTKGFSFKESSTAWAMYEFAAIPGTIACGWVSDKLFKGRRAPANILFMALTLVAVVVYWMNLHGPLWIDYAALIAIGFLIYGPIMIIGLHALDLVPKKAAGTAAGFTGFFGYVFGSAIAGTGVGWIADHWGWNAVFMTMVVCCVLTIVFVAMTLGHTTVSSERGAHH